MTFVYCSWCYIFYGLPALTTTAKIIILPLYSMIMPCKILIMLLNSIITLLHIIIMPVSLTSACSTCQREKVVVNPQLIPKHKHRNTLYGRLLLYPSLTELPSIKKMSTINVSDLGYLFHDRSSLHIIA